MDHISGMFYKVLICKSYTPLARTYLALLRRGKLPEGDDLKTVLAALFRPSGDGIVKDEGMPPSMVDFLTKLGR